MEITMDFFNSVMQLLNTILNYVFSFLPVSPFTSVLEGMGGIPFLGYINYFIPIDKLLLITVTWLGAVSVFYVYQIVLRWIKAIDD